jgi:hypothetical protein
LMRLVIALAMGVSEHPADAEELRLNA